MKEKKDYSSLVNRLCGACDRYELEEVRGLLNEHSALLKYVNKEGLHPLCHVVASAELAHDQQYNLVELLLKRGARLEDRFPKTGKSVLHVAAARNNTALLGLLIQHAESLELKDLHGYTPLLHVSAFSDAAEALEQLIEADADIHALNKKGENACHVAVSHCAIASLRVLVQSGADLFVQDKEMFTVQEKAIAAEDQPQKEALIALLSRHPYVSRECLLDYRAKKKSLEDAISREKKITSIRSNVQRTTDPQARRFYFFQLEELGADMRPSAYGYPQGRIETLQNDLWKLKQSFSQTVENVKNSFKMEQFLQELSVIRVGAENQLGM